MLYVTTFFFFYDGVNPRTIDEYFNDEARKKGISKTIASGFLKMLQEGNEIENKDTFCSYITNYLNNEDLKLVSDKIGEKIRETVKRGDEQEIKNLFLLGFFDYLNIDEVSPLMENLNFVELIFKLIQNRNCWDFHDGNKIHEFYSKYETLLTSQLKKKKKSSL